MSRIRDARTAIDDRLKSMREGSFSTKEWKALLSEEPDSDFAQWRLMKCLTKSFNGRLHRDRNRGGSPWTQFRFSEPNWKAGAYETDALLYRIDSKSAGAYFGLRQWLPGPLADSDAKLKRREHLRKLWSETLEKCGSSIESRKPSDQGKQESEIFCVLLDSAVIRQLVDQLPSIHRLFTKRLRDEGWPLLAEEEIEG